MAPAVSRVVKSRQLAVLPLFCMGLAGLSGCKVATQTGNAEAPDKVEQRSENAAQPVPLPLPPLDRASLIQATIKARSAAAAGLDDRDSQRELDGKDFELRIRFGCDGPAADLANAKLGWTFDNHNRVLRVRATPTVDLKDAVVRALKAQDVESVEGFWLPRPWMLESACPSRVDEAADEATGHAASVTEPEKPPASTSPKIGIARFFTETDPRTGRRDGRPYQATKTLDAGIAMGQHGFDLVLSGRLRSLAGDRVINCVPAGPDRAPDCVIAARVDRVRFEDPDSGESIAEWSGT